MAMPHKPLHAWAKTYIVRWEIEVDAGSPEGAAAIARDIQRDPGSTATVFDVRRKGGRAVRIDVARPGE